MTDLFTDHCIFILRHLRQISLHSDEEGEWLYEQPSLTVKYLIDKKLIEVKYPEPEKEFPMLLCLSDSGKDELRRLDNRAKRHMALIAVLIVCGTVCGNAAVNYLIKLTGMKSLFSFFGGVVYLSSILGFIVLNDQIEHYLKDYELCHSVPKWKSTAIALVSAIAFGAAYIFLTLAVGAYTP